MKYLKKLFLLCLVCLFGSLMFINAFADEVNNQKLIELKRYNPEDYPPISISAPTYHNLYPMSFDHGYSAVMVGYFEDVEIFKYSDNLIITDDGRASNDYDYLNLSSTLGVNISDLASAGVVTLGIDFRVMLHEIDDGYQYFYLYDNKYTFHRINEEINNNSEIPLSVDNSSMFESIITKNKEFSIPNNEYFNFIEIIATIDNHKFVYLYLAK